MVDSVEPDNYMTMMVAEIEGITVFLHEAIWVLHNKMPIPEGKLVYHKDGNVMNNNIENLDLVDENREYGDLHKTKTFHSGVIHKRLDFIKRNFEDIYSALDLDNYKEKPKNKFRIEYEKRLENKRIRQSKS